MPVEKEQSFTFDGKTYTYTYLEPTKEENLASLDRYPLFIATIEYFATGEGGSYYVLSSRAEDEDSFRSWANKESDKYFMSGASIYKNSVPEEDKAYNLLVSDRMKSILSDIVSGERDSGYFTFVSKQHMNSS